MIRAAGNGLRGLVPKPIRRAAEHRLMRSIFADEESSEDFRRLRAGLITEPVTIRVEPLGGAAVTLRPGTEDSVVFIDTFYGGHHLPPPSVHPIERVVDLGANIGLTMAHLAYTNPRARVTGVEMDAENAALCRINTDPWSDRCEVKQCAVWPTRGMLHYERNGSLSSRYKVANYGSVEVRAVPVGDLLHPGETVDYMKIDIEGSEEALLTTAAEWSPSVKSMRVEVHGAYRVVDCIADLRPLGFHARPDPKLRSHVLATRSR